MELAGLEVEVQVVDMIPAQLGAMVELVEPVVQEEVWWYYTLQAQFLTLVPSL